MGDGCMSAVDAVRSSLIDWFACAIAGLGEPVTHLVSERMLRYAAPGPAGTIMPNHELASKSG